MAYLKIQNIGVSSPDAFVLLGVTTSRGHTDSNVIGEFGQGMKAAVLLLLRNNINPIIYTGNLKIEFYYQPIEVNGQEFSQLCYTLSGKDESGKQVKRNEKTSMTLTYGTKDWNNIAFACREFLSNALDSSYKLGMNTMGVKIEVVDTPRAKSGHTNVFLRYTEEIQKIHRTINRRFLHFSEPESLKTKLLPKNNRNIDGRAGVACIYKKGVLIREYTLKDGTPSVFDYNLGEELTLDENRHVDDWTIKSACQTAILNGSVEDLTHFYKEIGRDPSLWEAKFDISQCSWDLQSVKDKRKLNHAAAWEAAFGTQYIPTVPTHEIAGFIIRKGYQPVIMKESYVNLLQGYGVRTDREVLSRGEKKGLNKVNTKRSHEEIVNTIWKTLESLNLTKGEKLPKISTFSSPMDGGESVLGLYDPKEHEVWLHDNLEGKVAYKVALEESIHAVTKSADNSRDLQDFLFQLCTEIMY